ncbi:hypothetical protein ACEQ8H_000253 [Pleosporales sp. CAS-2024a]
MDRDQVNEILDKLRELDSKVNATRAEINNRFNTVEQRINNLTRRVHILQDRIDSLSGQESFRGLQAHPLHGAGNDSNNSLFPRSTYTGSYEQRVDTPHGFELASRLTSSAENAGFLPFAMENIEKKRRRKRAGDHNTWDYTDCKQVKWEIYPDWERIVEMSFIAGLRCSDVPHLLEKLFPRDYFPHMWDEDGRFNR